MSTILDGKSTANQIIESIANMQSNGERQSVNVAIVQVGDNPASEVYVRNKLRKFDYLGWKYNHIHLLEQSDSEVLKNQLINQIKTLNDDKSVTGIFVQLPIAGLSDEQLNQVLDTINPHKDVDGFGMASVDGWTKNRALISNDSLLTYCPPCTPDGIIELLDRNGIEIAGKNVVVIGRSMIVGKPIATMLLNRNATVTICHSKTKDLSYYTRNADIIVSAVGKARFVTGMMIKPGCVLIDVGITREGNKIVGDIHPECYSIASYYTPVPGGVGPMTIAMLCLNAYNCAVYWKSKMSTVKFDPLTGIATTPIKPDNNMFNSQYQQFVERNNQLDELTKKLNELNDSLK